MFTLPDTETDADTQKTLHRDRYQHRFPQSSVPILSVLVSASVIVIVSTPLDMFSGDNVHLCILLLCNWFSSLGQTTVPSRLPHKREMCSDREELSKPARKIENKSSFNITKPELLSEQH